MRHRLSLMFAALRIRRGIPQIVSLALIACALVLRIVVPQGWMPERTADGWRITICTGTGPMQMDMPAAMAAAMKGAHHAPADRDHTTTDHPCAFAGFAAALSEPALPAVILPKPVVVAWLTGSAIHVAIGRGLAAPPPPATGPPLIL